MRPLSAFFTLLVYAQAQIAIRAEKVYTMAGPAIANGTVLISNGKIDRVGPSAQISVPSGYRTLTAKIVTPGLIDAHTVAGLSGYLNQPQDQEQVEKSAPMQPELRAIDAYDGRERLIEYLRNYGVTTLHTGHGPGALISGQTMIVKTLPDYPASAVLSPSAMIAATFGDSARDPKSPGSRAKMIALLRAEFIKAREYIQKPTPRDLRTEAFSKLVTGEMPLLLTVNRAGDIVTAIRLAREFNLKLILDGAAEAYMVLPQIKASAFPVILHPTMQRSIGETENLSLETASLLRDAGIPFALQSGYEAYVPKTRVVLFEAAVAAANGLTFDQALAAITTSPAKILGIDQRVGSLAPGKDADVALYDGDPFEYATHCVGVLIDGKLVSEAKQ